MFVAYFKGNQPLVEQCVNGRQPQTMHAVGDTREKALETLFETAKAAASKAKMEAANAKLRVLNVKQLLKPVEAR